MLKSRNNLFDVLEKLVRQGVRLVRLIASRSPKLFFGNALLFVLAGILTYAGSGARALLINELTLVAGSGVWTFKVGWFLLLVMALRSLPDMLWSLREYWNWRLWFIAEEHLNILLLEKNASIDIATHEDPQYQNLFQRVRENGIWRLGSFSDRMFYLFQNVVELLLGATILFTFHPMIFFVVFVGIIPELIVGARYSRSTWGIDTAKGETRRKYWNLQEHFRGVSNLTELKLQNLAPLFIARISALFREFRGSEEEFERERFHFGLGALSISTVAVSLVLGWGVRQVLIGAMQVGTLTFFFATTLDLRQALSSLFKNLSQQYKDALYLNDAFTLLDLKPALVRADAPAHLSPDRTPEICFENVSFRYTPDSEWVFRDINLIIPSGAKIALVGVNGAGKTTLIKLLCRFYDPTEGRILIDGVDLRDIEISDWWQKIGALFQDYAKYDFSVKESIAVSVPGGALDVEKVKESARSAEADLFIEAWEGAYDRQLGKEFEGGVEPSIGQWQKLALARTFYRDPRILVLDEPTASIDAEAEAKIFEMLENLPSDRTVVLISHRFSTVRHADKIIIMEAGQVTEQGSHKQLIALGGTYARLFKIQAKGYK